MHLQPTGLGQRFVIPQRARFPMDTLSSTPNIAIRAAMPIHTGLRPLLPQWSPRSLSLPSLHHALAPVLRRPCFGGAIPPVPPTSQRPPTAGPPATPTRCGLNCALPERPKHRGRSGWRVQGANMGEGASLVIDCRRLCGLSGPPTELRYTEPLASGLCGIVARWQNWISRRVRQIRHQCP